MGIVVTVMNMKGGVGKTTVAMHLGGIIPRYKIGTKFRKVLLIDYDPQFNMSQAFILPKMYFSLEKDRKTTLSILLDDEVNLDPFKLQVPGTETPPDVKHLTYSVNKFADGRCIDIIPSTLDLMYIALGQQTVRTKPIEERFKKFIGNCRKVYDLILIDCHPAGSLLTKTSLQNSDHVIIPVTPQRYAVRGVGLMMRFIESKQLGTQRPMAHILFNLMPRVGVTEVERDIRMNAQFRDKCIQHTLKFFTAFAEPFGGKGFVWHSSKPWSTTAFRNLEVVASEIVQRISNEAE